MTQQEVKNAVAKHGGYKPAGRALGVSASSLKRWASGECKPKSNVSCESSGVGRKLSDFRAAYDKDFIVPKRIKDGLKKLGCGGWEYEVVFAKSIGVSLMDLGAYREMFADNVVQISRDGRRAWAGSIATAKQMREMVS